MIAERVLAMVVFAALVFSSSPGFAESHQPESFKEEVESILGVSIATLACGEASKLDLIGMDFESCESQSNALFRGCWEMMDSIEPERTLEPRLFSNDASVDADLRTSTLTSCLKVSPLLFAENGPWSPGRPREEIAPSIVEERSSTWPPNAEDAVQNLSLYREGLEALRDLMVEAEYVAVAKSGDVDIIAIWETDGELSNKTLENPNPWLNLMVPSSVASVYRTDEMFSFSIADDTSETGRTDGSSYLYNDSLPAKKCEDRFRDVACGFCDISRDEQWTVRYLWMSGQHIEDYHLSETERFEERLRARLEEQNGEAAISFDDNGDATKELNLKNQECLLKGLREMGYDNAEEYF